MYQPKDFADTGAGWAFIIDHFIDGVKDGIHPNAFPCAYHPGQQHITILNLLAGQPEQIPVGSFNQVVAVGVLISPKHHCVYGLVKVKDPIKLFIMVSAFNPLVIASAFWL
jgi:hypothetical protein